MTTKRLWKLSFASFTIIFGLVLAVAVVQAQTSWTVPISINNSDPMRPQTTNVSFGVNPSAADGIDNLDVVTVFPPAPSPGQPYLNAGFAGPGLSYLSTDIRPAPPWKLIVASSGPLTLSWNTASVPVDMPLSMVSSDGKIIDMKALSSASFNAGSYSMVIKVPMPPAQITVAPSSGGKDTQITIEGINFGAMEQVTVDFGNTTAIATVTSGADGSLDATFMATPQLNGAVTITATGVTSEQQAQDATFMYSGPQITSVNVTGGLAKPGDTIEVTLVGESNGTATFSIAGIAGAANLQMTEETLGNYVGSYIVQEGDEVKDATVTATLKDVAGNEMSEAAMQKVTIITTIEFDLTLNAGLNLIAVPLADATAEGSTEPIMKVKNLGDALGKTWSLIISFNPTTGSFQSFTPTTPETAISNVDITGTTGLIVMMLQAQTLTLQGNAWPEGDINLNTGLNLIGVPLKDENLEKVSNLSALLSDSVNLIISIDVETGKFQSFTPTTPETAKSNIVINGGVGLILLMKSPSSVSVSGEPWMNLDAAPSLRGKLSMLDQTITPVIELDGTADVNGLAVTARNLSSGLSMTDTTGLTSGDRRFSITFADFVTNQAAKVGDVFEVSFSDSNGKFEVDSIRYTVTEQDIQLGRISLGNIVASAIPLQSELLANFPNPFNPETWIPFKLQKSSDISITIYDVHGRLVRTLELGSIPAGTYQTKAKAAYWDGTNDIGERVASGIYFYQLKANEFSASRKMVILK
jgi:hypothetical protein